jgi:hypothetical protein
VRLAKSRGPYFIPLVLFEDPDVLGLPIANMKQVHLLNTSAWLYALHDAGMLPDGLEMLARIDAARVTPMRPFEKEARTKKLRSQ